VLQIGTLAVLYATLASSREGGQNGAAPCALPSLPKRPKRRSRNFSCFFLSETAGGRLHDTRFAEGTPSPSPLPAGSRLLQDLGFLAFTLPQARSSCRPSKPHGQELTRDQRVANQALTQRRLRIEHVHSSVKRCRMVKDHIRLRKAGVRDLVMALCCALHSFRVRLSPWQSMVSSESTSLQT
jgi:hypothetical protein